MTGYPWAPGEQLFAADLNAAIAQSAPPVGTTFLSTGGGAMTGPLTLAGNATLPLQAVPLQQMNAAIAGVGGVSSITVGPGLTGGTITTTGTIALATPVGIVSGGTGATTGGAAADNLHGFTGSTAGIVRRTGAAAYSLDSASYLTGNQTISFTGDVTGSGTTSIAATVTRLQGQPVASGTPTSNQVLQYSGAQWAPATIPIPPAAAAPTATVSGSTVTGSASTYMRSDAAPALANTAVAAGSYTYSSLTVDAQGRLTAASSGTAPASVATTAPVMDGTATIGSDTTHFAAANHVHPTDTSRYAASNPSGYISGNQTITLSGDLGGAGTTAITATLATVNANVGTFQGLTVNAKGLVTAASNMGYAPLASPTFTGTPSLPAGSTAVTQTPGTSNTTLATTAFVGAAVAAGAAVSSFNTRTGAVTLSNADVIAVLPASTTTPLMDGTATIGVAGTWARADHQHPTDTSLYPASNPSGYQTAAQVTSSLASYAPLASPTFTGSVVIPSGASIAGYLPLTGGTVSGLLTASSGISVTGASTMSGGTTFTGGLNCGSTAASAVNNFSNQIALYGSAYGFTVTSGSLNYVTNTAAAHAFYVAATQVMQISTSGNLYLAGTAQPQIYASSGNNILLGGGTVNSGSVATTATTGFIMIPYCAGTPTGTPTGGTKGASIVYNTSSHSLNVYDPASAGWYHLALTAGAG